jgi:mono/diheme cytochrome c family protein
MSLAPWGIVMNRRVAWLLVGIGTFGHALDALGQTRTGREVYQFACAACHGSDGSGAPAVESGYPLVPPDFSDCNFSTREPAADWVGVSHHGGPNRAFSPLWRASMMAHAARDPYWQAGVGREVTDHPRAQAAIENECSRCHMPMAHVETERRGGQQSVFANIPSASPAAAIDPLAVEGVSCALCHQIKSDGLGSKASFTGGFVIETAPPQQGRQMFGPYEVEPAPRSVMRSATGLQPTASTHIQRSEVCATCHTLYTHALNASGEATSEFPEQMPYQEWLHSEFRDSQSCQSCHMPVVTEPMPIASVVGQPREAVSRHDVRGANFLMLGILNRFRAELGVVARPAEIDAAANCGTGPSAIAGHGTWTATRRQSRGDSFPTTIVAPESALMLTRATRTVE